MTEKSDALPMEGSQTAWEPSKGLDDRFLATDPMDAPKSFYLQQEGF
jgi:hypothetical protein